MAISTNALTLGAAVPANLHVPAHSNGSGASQAADDQRAEGSTGAQTGGEASTTSGPAGSSATGTGGSASQSATAGGNTQKAKAAGASAQTRSAQVSQAHGKMRARTAAAGSAGAPQSTDPQTSGDDSVSDFGSVMATALGRSAADADPATKTATDAGVPTGTSAAAAQTAPPAAEAMAWVAQVLMPASPAMTPPTAGKTVASGNDAAGAASGAADSTDTASAPAPWPLAANTTQAAAAAPGGVPAGRTAAAREDIAAQSGLSTATGSSSDSSAVSEPAAPARNDPRAVTATTTSTPLSNVNALADVQKMISGLTGASSAADGDGGDSDKGATPAIHADSGAATDAAQAAAALQANPLVHANGTSGVSTLTIHAAVGSTAFTSEVAKQVSSLAQAGITQAQLQLNPADLGPVQVHITMQAGQASVWFGANHADTRAALEQSLPQLRNMFATAGMPLTDAGVFREPPRQQAQSFLANKSSRDGGGAADAAPAVTQVTNVRLSLLDTYA